MNTKRILAALGVLLLMVIIYRTRSVPDGDPGYIFDNKDDIKLSDINDSLKKIKFDESSAKNFFAEDDVNPHTLNFFKFLQKKYKDLDYDEHLAAIKEYLYSVMPEDEAEKLYLIYKMFVEYELNMSKELNRAGSPGSLNEALSMLHMMHKYRRKFFGKNLADALFGASTKAKEYPIRRSAVLHDKSLYASEKEEKIKKLNEEMWGDEAGEVESYPEPYTKYKEKLQLYSKDMNEMTHEDRKQKIREIREKMFLPEVVERLERVDEQFEKDKEKENKYQRIHQAIVNDPDLSDEEKTKKIHELQDKSFGDGADAFRRRENIRNNRGIQ